MGSPSVKIIADGSIEPHFPVSAALSYRGGDRVFVDIKSDIEFLLHRCVCLFAFHIDESEKDAGALSFRPADASEVTTRLR
jgi:hypothetical protein